MNVAGEIVCNHGQLRRSCEICESEEEISLLMIQVAALRAEIDVYEEMLKVKDNK